MSEAKYNYIDELIKRNIRNELITAIIMLVIGLMLMSSAMDEAGDFVFVLAIIFFGGGAYFGWMCIQHHLDRNTHPLIREIAKYGNIEEIEESISTECDSPIFAKHTIMLTHSWVIQKGIYGATLMQSNDVLWVYKKVTQHSTNAIPTGKTYATMILSEKGTMEVGLSDEQTTTLLTEIANRFPWVILGYSKEVQHLWDKDRAAFAASIQNHAARMGNSSKKKEVKVALKYCSNCGKETSSKWKFCKSCGDQNT